MLALAYFDMEGRIFLEEFKNKSASLIREKIGLDGDIGNIEGGIFRGIVLKDVKLYGDAEKKQLFFSCGAIGLDYRLWDLELKRFRRLEKITFISPKVYFFDFEKKFSIPKVVEPTWKEMMILVRDGSFFNARRSQVISEFNGNFKLSEKGIESQNVSADVLGQKFLGRGKLGFPIEHSALQLEGAIKGRGYLLQAQLNGVPDKIWVHGSFDILEKLKMNFSGNITSSEGEVAFKDFNFGKNLTLDGLVETTKKVFSIDLYPVDTEGNATAMGEVSKVGVTGDFSKLPYFILNINAGHLKLLGFDLLSNYNINGKLDYGRDNRLESIVGDFSTSGSIINYNPIREVKGTYEISGNKIKLNGVNYGDVAFLNGSISLTPPNELDLNFKFKGAELGGLTDMTLGKDLVSGLVFGDVHVYGEPGKDLKIDGTLDFLNGNVSMIRYTSAKVTMKGRGNTLEFIDSKVYTEGQVLTLEGKMELKDIGTPRAFRYIAIKSDPNTVVWAGTSVISTASGKEFVSGADISEQFRINLKTYESRLNAPQRPKQDEVEMEYKLGKPGNIKLKMKENEDFFGVEHKVRF